MYFLFIIKFKLFLKDILVKIKRFVFGIASLVFIIIIIKNVLKKGKKKGIKNNRRKGSSI